CSGEDLSPDIKDWSKHQVRQWALKLDNVDDSVAEKLFQQDINGCSLLLLNATDLKTMGVTFGPAKLIIHARDEVVKLKREGPASCVNQPGRPCKPYPFRRYHDHYRYMESSILDITESGASNFIEPCHEYKAFINTTDDKKMNKFICEVIRFAAACMNSRTNGTIHFGIGDKPLYTHGQVLGVVVEDKEAYAIKLKSAIDVYFEDNHNQTAQNCIKPPRFVSVLNKNMTSSDKCVIEVDIVPESRICAENIYHTSSLDKNKDKKEENGKETKPQKQFFVREGGSSSNFLKRLEKYNQFVEPDHIKQLTQRRKQSEEKHLKVIKSSTQGSRLSQMITGGSLSLDKSHYERYVIVTNKSLPVQFEPLGFLGELNPTAVLDFDPESAKHGLQCHFEQQRIVSVHLPAEYKITEGVEDIANKLEFTRHTSWVFCNGGVKDVVPSEIDEWLMDKEASIRDVISFLCRKDVLPNKRFLVIFLLLSTVSDEMDPLVETFSTFYQELKGTEQILCVCDNENAFISWRDLIDARCRIDISRRCIYELSFAEVNGTILSHLSLNRRLCRFPSGGGSKVVLEKKVERSLKTLEVLCVNQCEGGNEDKIEIEENFYKGGKTAMLTSLKKKFLTCNKECAKKDIQSKSAQVILLNCMTSESTEDTEATEDTVFIGNDLSEKEQEQFERKLVEIEKTHKNAQKTFYGFMIMKKNFSTEYVEGVARKTLKSFDINEKHAQLLAVLVMLNIYCKGASLSVSLCEEFLGLQPQPFCGTIKVKDRFRKFSTLISSCSVEGKVVFTAVKMIHSSIAKHCLQELTTTHKVRKADIADLLLTTNELYESTQGKDKLLQDVHHILVKRYHSLEEGSDFSPLIQQIAKETPGLEETVLQNASKRFAKDAIISQLLARYYYLKKKGFSEAKIWAKKARDLSKDSSYMADTSAQVIKHELKNAIANSKEETIRPEKLSILLKMAQSAIDAFKETQSLAKQESLQRLKIKTDNNPFNTSGCLGEIQVGVLVIEVLAKTPIFSSDNVRRDIMSQVLSGNVKLQDVERSDRSQNELFRCFKQYKELFCRTDSADLLRNKTMQTMLKLHQTRQELEMQKADTYSGILSFLSNGKPPETMERIVRQYGFVFEPGHKLTVKEKINFLYVNVVLSRLKLESPLIQPYQRLVHLLYQVLQQPISLSDSLSLHFIAVVLLWPKQGQAGPACRSLGNYISQMRTSYHQVMREMYNGKRPVIHFFLGKKWGYERLVPLGEIKKCIRVKQEMFSSMWENGIIWKEKKVKKLLCRVTGRVMDNMILADTCIPDLKVEVAPVFRSELRGHDQGSKVSFFLSFSMKGPVALDIN
uniref:SAM domain-containing protein n=1 Tax=Sparus aurata TaxID=8175 RepID=A0A671XRX4_SPAAU